MKLHYWRAVTWALLIGLGACSGPSEESARSSGPDASAVATNNRGVGLMGQYQYEEARALFGELAESHPDWLDSQVNLAIATLNRQKEGDEQAALAIVDKVLQTDPQHLRAHYVAGLLRLYLGNAGEALTHFRQVAEADPDDAYAAYYLAQCLAQASQHQEALHWYRRATEKDPYLRSAYYGMFQALQRLKRVDEARQAVADYQRLANNPRARLAEFKYTRMGPKADALAMDQRPAAPVAPSPGGPAFGTRKPLALREPVTWEPPQGKRPVNINAVDMNGDGRLALFVADMLSGDDAHNLILMPQRNGVYALDRTHPLAAIEGVNAALWADFDNDGRVDVYLCRKGPNQMWRQRAPGHWEDVTEGTATAGGNANTVDGMFFDADHDGDLDIFLVNADGPNELLNNNRDGTFQALASEHGIAGDVRASRAVIPADIDGDRDADLVVLNAQPPHEVYLNDRLWAYRPAAGFDDFRAAPALAGLAADIDADGHLELYTIDPQGQLVRWRSQASGVYASQALATVAGDDAAWAQLAVADVTGNGVLEILAFSPAGWAAYGVGEDDAHPLFQAQTPAKSTFAGGLPVLTEASQGPAVIGWQGDGLYAWPPGLDRFPYLALSFSGKEDSAASMRSNAAGIGTRAAVRRNSHWTVVDTFRNHSGPGQSQQPIAVGLGGAPAADFVAIDWSDGVFQSELNLTSGKLHDITETQRQLSSCPVLFAWDGTGYAFVSDLLGVGGIGYAVGPGEYAVPRPWENFLFPAGLFQPRAGHYALKVTEPMEEVAYLDALHLALYDLPPEWHLVLDERMGIGEPVPTGAPRFYRTELLPDHAVNASGEVTETLIHTDGRATPVGALDGRFVGRLANEHILTLTFPVPLDSQPGEPVLVVDGWVEYPYSQTMFAAWQAGARFDAPTIEARGADGHWQVLLREFGYPAGMPRRMSVPLPTLPPGTTMLRIRTNMQVYWDRISVVFSEPPPDLRQTRVAASRARVAKTGFPVRTTSTQFRPHYDYASRGPFWDTRYMAGYYTRLGPALELVSEVDDAVAIIGPGEEVHVEFPAPPPPPPGWNRFVVLESRGWTKDMDLYTRDGETVGPLPVASRPSERRKLLHARFQTRYQAGR